MLEMDADNTQSFVIGAGGLDVSRSIPHGFGAMISVVQKELNLKDDESARKLFYSNTFDFTNMGGLLTKKVLKELQSLIGFYEVQTGQSIGQVLCTQMPPKLAWLGGSIAKELGVEPLKLDFAGWLKSREISFCQFSRAIRTGREMAGGVWPNDLLRCSSCSEKVTNRRPGWLTPGIRISAIGNGCRIRRWCARIFSSISPRSRCVLCLVLSFWYQEYRISALDRQVADWQSQIATEPESRSRCGRVVREICRGREEDPRAGRLSPAAPGASAVHAPSGENHCLPIW